MFSRSQSFMFLSLSAILGFSLLAGAEFAAADDGFPLRVRYPDVKVISTVELKERFDQVIIIDVRSNLEYDVIHMRNALHNPVTRDSFTRNLKKVRALYGDGDIVFYCNGHTCSKSYKASRKATEAGFKNIYAYDAGIFDWTNANPDSSVLMGVSPVDPAKIIDNKSFKKHLIPMNEFMAKANDPNALVIDIREPFQKQVSQDSLETIDIPQVDRIVKNDFPSDKLKFMLTGGRFRDRQLLIYDAVGKQVRWLQYYLEHFGYSDFYFLDKGVKGTQG